jgi:hypothetical protein
MKNKARIPSVLLIFASLLLSSTVKAQNGDSANIPLIVGLTHPSDRPITVGRPFSFRVTVQYSLSSVDVADLNIGVEEYPKASGCGGSVHVTNGGITTQITRGSAKVDAKVTWNGAKPVYGKGGFLRINVTFLDPKTKMVFRSFPNSSDCFPFVPPTVSPPTQRID